MNKEEIITKCENSYTDNNGTIMCKQGLGFEDSICNPKESQCSMYVKSLETKLKEAQDRIEKQRQEINEQLSKTLELLVTSGKLKYKLDTITDAISTNLQTFKGVIEDVQEHIRLGLLPENPTIVDYCLCAIYEARNKIDSLQNNLDEKNKKLQTITEAINKYIKLNCENCEDIIEVEHAPNCSWCDITDLKQVLK